MSANFVIGVRATIEGQVLALCHDEGDGPPSGSFQWTAIGEGSSVDNIVQVGYGRCARTDNGSFGSTNCNGNLYWYWAWGGDCGSGVNGTGGSAGPIPLRIGPALSSPPSSSNFYVFRESVGGVEYYDGYVNGVLLQGTDALGNNRIARVAASSVCWNSSMPLRYLFYFGEVFNDEDSMGGWAANGTKNNLDYTAMQYSYATGWKSTNFSSGNCYVETARQIYTCTIAAPNHIFINTIDR
jgi:hypothetical protein